MIDSLRCALALRPCIVPELSAALTFNSTHAFISTALQGRPLFVHRAGKRRADGCAWPGRSDIITTRNDCDGRCAVAALRSRGAWRGVTRGFHWIPGVHVRCALIQPTAGGLAALHRRIHRMLRAAHTHEAQTQLRAHLRTQSIVMIARSRTHEFVLSLTVANAPAHHCSTPNTRSLQKLCRFGQRGWCQLFTAIDP